MWLPPPVKVGGGGKNLVHTYGGAYKSVQPVRKAGNGATDGAVQFKLVLPVKGHVAKARTEAI